MSEQEQTTFAQQLAKLDKLRGVIQWALGAFGTLIAAIFALGADYSALRSDVAQGKVDRQLMESRIEILQKQRLEDQKEFTTVKEKIIATNKDVEWIRDTLGGRRGN